MRSTGVRRRVVGSALTWVLVLGVVRITVLLPESCPPVDRAALRTAIEEAVAWFDRNQADDGTWLYRYDRARDEVVPGYNTVRHAGVTMSLYQAARAGIPGALEVADRGTAYALDNLVRHDGWAAFEPSSSRVTSGAAALLVAGLTERRALTGDERYDELLTDLGEFLVSLTGDDGSVLASWDRQREAPDLGVHSPFFTGEVFWALALLDEQFPEAGWGEPAGRIGRYLATERDDAEGYWPDVPDHWAAYGFSVLATTDGPEALDEAAMHYLRRQAGFGGVQARYESQRVDTTPRWWLRGRRTLGAGLGTVGEQLAGLWAVAQVDPRLADLEPALAERTTCVAGMLVERQVDADEAEAFAEPGAARGAWFQFEVTQMDDQQHAMSALLLTHALLDDGSIR